MQQLPVERRKKRHPLSMIVMLWVRKYHLARFLIMIIYQEGYTWLLQFAKLQVVPPPFFFELLQVHTAVSVHTYTWFHLGSQAGSQTTSIQGNLISPNCVGSHNKPNTNAHFVVPFSFRQAELCELEIQMNNHKVSPLLQIYLSKISINNSTVWAMIMPSFLLSSKGFVRVV